MEQDQADKLAHLKEGEAELNASSQFLLKEFLDQKEKIKPKKTIDNDDDDEEDDDDDDEDDVSPFSEYTIERVRKILIMGKINIVILVWSSNSGEILRDRIETKGRIWLL